MEDTIVANSQLSRVQCLQKENKGEGLRLQIQVQILDYKILSANQVQNLENQE